MHFTIINPEIGITYIKVIRIEGRSRIFIFSENYDSKLEIETFLMDLKEWKQIFIDCIKSLILSLVKKRENDFIYSMEM